MPTSSILVATWDNGLFSVTGKMVCQELADQSVRGLVADRHGGVLAIAGGHSLCRRSSDGEWTEIAKSEFELSCCVPIGDVVFVGTDDAHILRVDPDGAQQCLTGFDAVAGRDKWYAGAAIIDGKRVGAAAWNSFDGGDMRWCRATGQRPCWRNSAINRFRPNLAAHYRYRKRCSSGLCTSNPARYRDRSGGGGSLHQPRCWSDMDHREPRTSRPSLLCRCFWEKRHFRVGIHRPFCEAGRSLSTPDRRERSATAFGRHAEVDRR
jgi:hypothetical protein